MADFTQIIQEINDDINTNGVGAIKGAKLNQVLRDMIAAVNAELEKQKYVELFINSTQKKANFIWPFEDTTLDNLEIIGYVGSIQNDSSKILRDGVQILGTSSYASYNYIEGHTFWNGELTTLQKGYLYSFQGAYLTEVNAHVYIRPRQ